MRGTIKELVGNKIKMNDVLLTQSDLSVLTRLGVAMNVGTASKAPNSRGRASTIWEIDDCSVVFTSE